MTTDPDGVSAVSWAPGRIDLFWVGADGGLVHRASEGGTWQEPESLGGTLASPPAATAWAVDELQVFAIFPDGQLWNRYWDGSYWHDWESLGGELTGSPSASSWASVHRRLVARSRRHDLAPLVGRHPLGRMGTVAGGLTVRQPQPRRPGAIRR